MTASSWPSRPPLGEAQATLALTSAHVDFHRINAAELVTSDTTKCEMQ